MGEASMWSRSARGQTVALVSIYDTENNAVRQLAAGLRRRGRRVLEVYFKDWRNNRFEPPTRIELRMFESLLGHEDVGLVGISLRASAYQDVSDQLCRLVRARLRVPIVVGGWHATVRPDRCLDMGDAICRGEADQVWPDFVEYFFAGDLESLMSCPGFWVRRADGKIQRQPVAPVVRDLDALPWRDYTSRDKWWIEHDRLRQGDPMNSDPLFQVMATIGCPRSCSFCHNSFKPDGVASPVRMRSVSSVIAELEHRIESGVTIRRVRFDDEIFGLKTSWLEEFARRWPREVGLPFDILTEPNVVTESYARLLGGAGATHVHMGIQSSGSVNDRELSRAGSSDVVLEVSRRLRRHGIHVRYLVMVDIPTTTEADRLELFHLFQKVPAPFDLYLFSLTYFPGSQMVEKKLHSGELSPEDVEGAARKTFSQYRVDLGHPRSPADTRWIALLVLQSSGLVPRRVLEAIVRRGAFRDDPTPLVRAAYLATMGKTARIGAGMIARRELTTTLIRRWLNPRTTITM